ncbi:hypothetical protein [uncultured Oscillibacter sp.]|uniref:hypothetical protein n=1 Tax=uncultured Oscillibacter sp. TaxID=876091 RepID=UPI00260C2FF4|nr:hypothetical protein [uncultured Oscillibacter sp.]
MYALRFRAVPFSAAVDFFVYTEDFLYDESRPLGLLFLAVQAAAVAPDALLIRSAAGKRQ